MRRLGMITSAVFEQAHDEVPWRPAPLKSPARGPTPLHLVRGSFANARSWTRDPHGYESL